VRASASLEAEYSPAVQFLASSSPTQCVPISKTIKLESRSFRPKRGLTLPYRDIALQKRTGLVSGNKRNSSKQEAQMKTNIIRLAAPAVSAARIYRPTQDSALLLASANASSAGS
jgi:hypothetical protein